MFVASTDACERLHEGISKDELADLILQNRNAVCDWEGLMSLVCMTSTEIKEYWSTFSQHASNAGTWMHAMFEHVLNGYDVVPAGMLTELRIFVSFMQTQQHLRVRRTEWMIFAEAESLAGSIDLVLRHPETGDMVLVDWKRSAKLDQKYNSFGRQMVAPIDAIPDCQGWHYRLQLNIYRWILETYYGAKIVGMFVVCAHPNYAPDGFIDKVPDMQVRVEDLMNERRAIILSAALAEAPVSPTQYPDTQDLHAMDALEAMQTAARAAPEDCPPVPRGSQARDVRPLDASQDDVAAILDAMVDDMTEAVPACARKRRLLKGATDTQQMFENGLKSYLTAVDQDLSGVQADVRGEDDSALQTTRRMLAQVRQQYPHWSEDMCRLTTVAGHVCQARLSDRVMMVDAAALLWMVEGDRHIRVHKGFCYIYDDNGAFVPYGGTPPEAVLGRVQKFFAVLEGIFRRMDAVVRRKPDAVVNAVASDLQTFTTEAEFMRACLDASLNQQGGPPQQPRLDDPEDEMEPPQFADAGRGRASEPWTLFLAKKLWKVAQSIKGELLQTRLISLLVEWCETPDERRSCVAYTDLCIRYDAADGSPTTVVPKDPANSCYVSIPHPMLDPVLLDCQQRLIKFYTQTFWCNNSLFECNQAALALAKRGLNIDRCFIGQSPGGVGQSLYSQHLAEMYKHNHCYFDPNVWHNEEELRKQVESFARCMICTGQEAPESSKKLHTDLYKKTMSADGITGRKPYGYTTRMFAIVGWKRLETNKLMHFSGVNATNFNSILRRALVWKPKARFLNPKFLVHYPDHEVDGFFREDPTLGRFLSSSQASLAGMRLQHGFETKHSKDECYQLIEEYATGGGDEYLTEDSMRLACGLPLRQRHAEPEALIAQFGAEPGSQADKDDGVGPWQTLRDVLVKFMLDGHKESITYYEFKKIQLPDRNMPNLPKEDLWKGLVDRKLVQNAINNNSKTGRKTESYMPLLTFESELADVIDVRKQDCDRVFTETHSLQDLHSYLHACSSRKHNMEAMQQYLSATSVKLTKGRPNKDIQDRKTAALASLRKIEEFNKYCEVWQTKLASSSKRRRLQSKTSEAASQGSFCQGEQECQQGDAEVVYHYAGDYSIRSRRYADSGCAQTCPRRIASHTLAQTIDLDIQ
jgi:hypothetical protein